MDHLGGVMCLELGVLMNPGARMLKLIVFVDICSIFVRNATLISQIFLVT